MTIANTIKNLVPITNFNKGKSSQIFASLKDHNELIVLKNNQAVAIIVTPEKYEELEEAQKDLKLLLEAQKRYENNHESISMDDVMKKYNLSQEKIDDLGGIEFE